MKFLCITCNEGLRHHETRGPEDGVMTVIFACPGCGWEMAMYTNPWETQMVRSLDVKIGGRSVPAEPIEMLRSSLGQGKLATPAPASAADRGEAPTCPFAEVVASAYDDAAATPNAATGDDIRWTPEAEQRIEQRIPSFVRPMARMGIEKYARERGYHAITPQVLDEAKNIFMG
ncbi:Light-independent protochlorophyllide reductase subunit B [Candidatus Entotheonellaceae bacterium PAL068K]